MNFNFNNAFIQCKKKRKIKLQKFSSIFHLPFEVNYNNLTNFLSCPSIIGDPNYFSFDSGKHFTRKDNPLKKWISFAAVIKPVLI